MAFKAKNMAYWKAKNSNGFPGAFKQTKKEIAAAAEFMKAAGTAAGKVWATKKDFVPKSRYTGRTPQSQMSTEEYEAMLESKKSALPKKSTFKHREVPNGVHPKQAAIHNSDWKEVKDPNNPGVSKWMHTGDRTGFVR